MHRRPLQVDNRHRRVLVRVEFDKGEPPVGLHADLDDVAEALEEGDDVGLRGVGDEVTDVDGRVERGSLNDDFVVLYVIGTRQCHIQ